MFDFIMVKDLLEFFVVEFGRHPFYNESYFYLDFGRLLEDLSLSFCLTKPSF